MCAIYYFDHDVTLALHLVLGYGLRALFALFAGKRRQNKGIEGKLQRGFVDWR